MKIQRIEAKRRAQLCWLSPQEVEGKEIMNFLQHDFSLQKEQGVLPVIIESGSGELEEQLYLLMKRNIDSKHVELEKAS